MRIVSLLPSATEIVCGLGLQKHLVGVSHECDFPESVLSLPKVTRTSIPTDSSSSQIDDLVRQRVNKQLALYTLDLEALRQLQPDLIITQTLCDVCAVAESDVQQATKLLDKSVRVVNLQPNSLSDLFECIHQVAEAAFEPELAEQYVITLQERVAAVRSNSATAQPVSVVVLEWIDPLFSAGHWTPELVEIAGGRELIGKAHQRSSTIDWQAVVQADPDVLIIACCGFTVDRAKQDLPILQNKPGWNELRCVRNLRVHVVDGSAFFNRPGPRLVDSLEMLAELLDIRNPQRSSSVSTFPNSEV